MRAKTFFIAALALADVCFAQMPTPTAPSSWEPSQSLDLSVPRPSSSRGALSSSSAAAASETPPATSPVAESKPATTSRNPQTGGQLSYVEGSIWVLTFIKTKPGTTDDYFKSISASLKPVYEEEKRKRMILDYKILNADSGEDRDFNVIIMVEYPSRAAVEGSRDRVNAILDKVIGPASARRDLATKRQDVREILATKMMREIWLK